MNRPLEKRPPTTQPFDLVVFGGGGDLALRKLMPALYHRERDGRFAPGSRIFGVSRSPLDDDAYAARVAAACRTYAADDFDPDTFQRFRSRLSYVPLAVDDPQQLARLGALLGDGRNRPRVFYMATAPDLFGPACRNLAAAGLVTPDARVVLEKPLGHDLASFQGIDREVGSVFPETAIFRIDHYLGKETVQNLMALRFANRIFEPLWSAAEVDHIQITVAETIGVEGRGDYYDRTGALRDMVQNHMLQLLCLTMMEPPQRFDADSVRDEKVKVLKALRPFGEADVAAKTVRGQYRAGAVDGHAVPGYAEESGRPDSQTETYVALKAELDNWRWAGTPIYLRTAKRLPLRTSEITVAFRRVPHSIFPPQAGPVAANRMVIRLQPDEGVQLLMMAKVPEATAGVRLRRVPLNLSFAETFRTRTPDAYERLLFDVVRGDATLFMRRDEVEAAWRWVEPILAAWEHAPEAPRPYPAGTWGPSAAVALMAKDGRTWAEEMD